MEVKVDVDPATEAAKLAELFRAHDGKASAVASALGIHLMTLYRRLKRLAEQGHDVRQLAGTPGRPGRRPTSGAFVGWRKRYGKKATPESPSG